MSGREYDVVGLVGSDLLLGFFGFGNYARLEVTFFVPLPEGFGTD